MTAERRDWGSVGSFWLRTAVEISACVSVRLILSLGRVPPRSWPTARSLRGAGRVPSGCDGCCLRGAGFREETGVPRSRSRAESLLRYSATNLPSSSLARYHQCVSLVDKLLT